MKPISFLISFSLIVVINTISAQYVNIQTAEQIAQNFYFKQYNIFEGTINRNNIKIKESFKETQNGEEVLYIFNISSGGFVIIPTEKAIEPILGYSFKGAYNPDNTHSNFLAWLQMYKNKVSYLKENQIKPNKELNSKWEEILQNTYNYKDDPKNVDPLVSAGWSPDSPYNIHCPEDPQTPNGYCSVGPVGLVMGQIMYYWRYPLTGNDSIFYTLGQSDTISVNFGATDYEWTGMQDYIDYNNPSPIALLLFHCAASVQTYFCSYGLGAFSQDVPFALINYFNYDGSCEYIERQGIALTTWKQMLKEELDSLRPVYYSGATPPPNSGHAFLVDGYHEVDDFFHFNFGWNGYMNGWYAITDAGGFSENQAMVRNIFPGDDYPYYCQESDTITTFSGTIDDGSGITANYLDNANCNWLIAPQSENDSISGLILNFLNFNTETGNDIVTIYDGPTNAHPILGSFSGTILPPQIAPSGNTVLVNFSTNSTNTEQGWLLSFESEYPVYCTETQSYTNSSDFISDGSDQFYYRNNTNCIWFLEPPEAEELTFQFTSFQTEEDKDIVRFYDASNNMLLAEYSGMYQQNNLPPPVTSPSGEMFITFQSDIINNAPGWEGYYFTETGNIMGQVYNINTNLPVSGAVVNIGSFSDTSNISGNFSISDIPVGTYEIEVTAVNYYPLSPGMTVEIISGNIVNVYIPLGPMYLYPPQNVQYQFSNEDLLLFWDLPQTNPWQLNGYNVYCRPLGGNDFEKINDEIIPDTFYVDNEFPLYLHTEYIVKASYNEGESGESNIILVVIEEINEDIERQLQVFPNPAKDKLYIIIPKSYRNNQCILNLCNSNGEKIMSRSILLEDNIINLNIQSFERGIYLINLQLGDFQMAKKIIIE